MATEFDVLEAGAVAKRVVSEVENVVGFVVGQVDLEQVQFIVDGVDEADAPGQEVERADAAVSEAAVPLGKFVMDVGRFEDGRVEILELGFFEAVADALLAAGQTTAYAVAHSNSLFAVVGQSVVTSSDAAETKEFRAFSEIPLADTR